jgi:ubiquinone biosynthesis protein
MGKMGDKFICMKQNGSIRNVYSKKFYFAVLLIVSTYVLLNGGASFWVGFVGSVLIVILSIIRGN